MSTSIVLHNLTKSFGGPVPAVDAVDLRMEAGELFFLLGPSGCGKTTLLRMIAGFIEPTAGDISFHTASGAHDVTRLPPNKRNTGMVFQSYALWPHMTVEANVAFGLDVRKVSAQETRRRVGEALELVRMSEFASRKPTQLSGGQQQRVALARALVIRPDVLLLDEPLSNLDARLRIELRAEIRRICKEARTGADDRGITTIYVTHDQKEALSMADRIAIMRDGRVVQIGEPRALYRAPASPFVAEFLGETNFIRGVVESTGDFVRVRTPAADILGRSSTAVSPGEPVICSIRPEAIRPDAMGPNLLHARVLRTTYLGEIAQFDAELRSNGTFDAQSTNIPPLPLKISVMNPAIDIPCAHNSELTVSVSPEDVVIFPQHASSI